MPDVPNYKVGQVLYKILNWNPDDSEKEKFELQTWVIRSIQFPRRKRSFGTLGTRWASEKKRCYAVKKDNLTWVVIEKKKGKDGTYKRGWASYIADFQKRDWPIDEAAPDMYTTPLQAWQAELKSYKSTVGPEDYDDPKTYENAVRFLESMITKTRSKKNGKAKDTDS